MCTKCDNTTHLKPLARFETQCMSQWDFVAHVIYSLSILFEILVTTIIAHLIKFKRYWLW